MNARGFTTIELILAIAIVIILFALGGQVFSLIQQTAASASGTTALDQILGSAARRARSGSQRSSWGVYLPYNDITRQMSTATVFSGANYASRDVTQDTSYRFNSGVELMYVDFSGALSSSGNDHEIVFSALSGETSQYGSVTLNVYGETFTITITADGFAVLE